MGYYGDNKPDTEWYEGKEYKLSYDEFGSSPRRTNIVVNDTTSTNDSQYDDDYDYEKIQAQREEREHYQRKIDDKQRKTRKVSILENILTQTNAKKRQIEQIGMSLRQQSDSKERMMRRKKCIKVLEFLEDILPNLNNCMSDLKQGYDGESTVEFNLRYRDREYYEEVALKEFEFNFSWFQGATDTDMIHMAASKMLDQITSICEDAIHYKSEYVKIGDFEAKLMEESAAYLNKMTTPSKPRRTKSTKPASTPVSKTDTASTPAKAKRSKSTKPVEGATSTNTQVSGTRSTTPAKTKRSKSTKPVEDNNTNVSLNNEVSSYAKSDQPLIQESKLSESEIIDLFERFTLDNTVTIAGYPANERTGVELAKAYLTRIDYSSLLKGPRFDISDYQGLGVMIKKYILLYNTRFYRDQANKITTDANSLYIDLVKKLINLMKINSCIQLSNTDSNRAEHLMNLLDQLTYSIVTCSVEGSLLTTIINEADYFINLYIQMQDRVSAEAQLARERRRKEEEKEYAKREAERAKREAEREQREKEYIGSLVRRDEKRRLNKLDQDQWIKQKEIEEAGKRTGEDIVDQRCRWYDEWEEWREHKEKQEGWENWSAETLAAQRKQWEEEEKERKARERLERKRQGKRQGQGNRSDEHIHSYDPIYVNLDGPVPRSIQRQQEFYDSHYYNDTREYKDYSL